MMVSNGLFATIKGNSMPKHRQVVQDMLANQLREYEGIKNTISRFNKMMTFLSDFSQPRMNQLTYLTDIRRIFLNEI